MRLPNPLSPLRRRWNVGRRAQIRSAGQEAAAEMLLRPVRDLAGELELLDRYHAVLANRLEGHAGRCAGMTEYLARKASRENGIQVLEIGFNAGHSSLIWLQGHPGNRVVSVDLGLHPYVLDAKRFIDLRYPTRHELFVGDSKRLLPVLAQASAWQRRFGLILVDGGHDYPTARADLENCRAFAQPESLVVMDDLSEPILEALRRDDPVARSNPNNGPSSAWSDLLAGGVLRDACVHTCRRTGHQWGEARY
jgi:predicted O-methyltransferase YrrM